MQTLTFQNITLTPAKIDKQIWLTSADLAKALGYSRSDEVNNLYNRKKDEFTANMTQTAEIQTKGGLQRVRIFSLRGCHLIAMFARTKVAKEFRQWVLDILDKEVGQPVPVKTTAHDRTPLIQACTRLSAGYMNISDVYKMVGNHFGYDDVQSIPSDKLPQAVAFVYELILARRTPKHQTTHALLSEHNTHNQKALTAVDGMIDHLKDLLSDTELLQTRLMLQDRLIDEVRLRVA